MPDQSMSRREFVRDSAAAAATLAAGVSAAQAAKLEPKKALSYNSEMAYRRCGKTNWMVSSVCLGGHWKRVDKMVPGLFKGKRWLSADVNDSGFVKNRHEVVSRCIERGINYIDACTWQEVVTYARALKGRRDKMHLAFSWYHEEMRNADFRTTKALLGTLDKGMKKAGLDYVDVWRITMHEQSQKHIDEEVEQMMRALEEAKKQGKARAVGFSSHRRPHIKRMIEKYTDIIDVIVTPYTSNTKAVKDKDGLWAAVKKHDLGWFGIKPFAGTSLFKGSSAPDCEHRAEDDKRARLAIRYILCNDAITAPIPGLINSHQVDNVAKAIKERRTLDATEKAELDQASTEAWANLPHDYQWLKEWEYV